MTPNPGPCPRCHAEAMSDWQPLDAYRALLNGNHFTSTCAECNAEEQRPAQADEIWVPAAVVYNSLRLRNPRKCKVCGKIGGCVQMRYKADGAWKWDYFHRACHATFAKSPPVTGP